MIKEEHKNYIVNTNVSDNTNNYLEMINEKRAAGYGTRRHGIEKMNKGDTVFLFHVGIGIIAYGVVNSEKHTRIDEGYTLKGEHYEREEYYVDLLPFCLLADPDIKPNKAITAQQINEQLSSPQYFGQTVRLTSQETADVIKALAKENERNS